MPEPLLELLGNAPAVVAVIYIVIVFLKHIREADHENRLIMGELRDALKGLRDELKADREERIAAETRRQIESKLTERGREQ